MVISINGDLEGALRVAASRKGVSPEELAVASLRERFLRPVPFEPRNDWDRALLAAASDCGVSLSNEAVSSEGLYD
jgi:hypothetical protein